MEGMRLAEIVHLREGIAIYARPSAERFDATIYGPLYYLLGTRLVDVQNPTPALLRLVSVLGTLFCGVGCALLAKWVGGSYRAAALAPLIFFSYGIITFYGVSVRCDSVALSMSFGGFLVAYHFRESKYVLFAVPLMLLGFFYKQQFVAAPLAVLVFLFLGRKRRLAIWFGAALGLGGLLLLAVFQFVVFRDQAFLTHFLVYNMLPFNWTDFREQGLRFGVLFIPPLLCGLEHLRLHHNKLLTCYLACAVVISTLGFAKEGSSTNYYLESLLILSPLVAALLEEKMIQSPLDAIAVLVILSVSFLWGSARRPPGPADFASDRATQDYLRNHFPRRALALSWFTGDLVRAGLESPVSDLYQYTQLIRKGTLSDRDLLDALSRRRFNLVALDFDLQKEKNQERLDRYTTESMRQAILTNYQPLVGLEMPYPERLYGDDRLYLWVPREGSILVQPHSKCEVISHSLIRRGFEDEPTRSR